MMDEATSLLVSDNNNNNNNNGSNSNKAPARRAYSDSFLDTPDTSRHGGNNSNRQQGRGSGGNAMTSLMAAHLTQSSRRRISVSNDPDLNADTNLYGSTLMLATYLRQQQQQQRQQRPSQQQFFLESGHGHAERAGLAPTVSFSSDKQDDDDKVDDEAPPPLLRLSASLTQSVRNLVGGPHPAWLPDWWITEVVHRLHPPGSLLHSLVLAMVIALVNGVACCLYYVMMEWGLHWVWKTLPIEWLQLNDQDSWWWIPLAGFSCSLCLACTVLLLGEPGDMPFTVACVHQKGFIPMDHVLPMVFASFFSIIGGASLGPEAPLVAICGAAGGWVSRTLFQTRQRWLVRKHTLMGMAGALAAFFGVPMGGSLFALEINSRFGVEYFEDLMSSILCGELTMVVFRFLAGLPIGPIWNLTTAAANDINDIMPQSAELSGILPMGVILGLVGAGMAYGFALFHAQLMKVFGTCGLLDNSRAVYRALAGGVLVYSLGLLVPHTLFWSEEELPTVVLQQASSTLPHVWPTQGIWGAIHRSRLSSSLEATSNGMTALVGILKLVSISMSLAQGSRGGFIFPFFLAGGAVGRALAPVLGLDATEHHRALAALCVAAACNTAITRTALATTLILIFLSGEWLAGPAILMASLTSLFTTGTIKFIKTQMARSDIDHSMYHRHKQQQQHLRNTTAAAAAATTETSSEEDEELADDE